MQKTMTAALVMASLSTAAIASEDMHTKDPRNAGQKVGLEVQHNGDLKLIGGGGATNWYAGSDNQLVYQAEYELDSEYARVRGANFDSRFGGLYVDIISIADASVMSTVGFMLPITADNGKTLFFPSINYSYVAHDKKALRGVPDEIGGGNASHLSSLNLYILHPWNETHFSFIEMVGGKSFSGVEMEMYDVVWTQGMNSNILGQPAMVYFKGQYSRTEVYGQFTGAKGSLNSDEAKFSFGFELKF
ncbi:hypothetical protein L2755_13625 [Shewanella abyssi]|uniref:hypothetical protein n=1 Tax=Shewanella abyssi TaxID=311789 RepID=UPI00200D03BA|nr:hypothetical protein [Shewanella abyssi]MCL1050654.1 hypothetical protein [Shewanella abyssi]